MKRCGNNDIAVSIQALAPCLSFRLRNDLDRSTIQRQSSSSAGSPSATGIVSGRGLLHAEVHVRGKNFKHLMQGSSPLPVIRAREPGDEVRQQPTNILNAIV